MATPEGKVKAMVKRVLDKYRPDLRYRMPVPCGYGKQDLDFYGCYRGRYFAIETKAARGKLTARQELDIQEIERAGGATFVIRDKESLGELETWLLKSTQWMAT